jgi:hypothetical protein
MVRGRRGGRRRGTRGGGVMPPVASTPEGSNPQGDEQVLRQEKIAVGDVIGMMRSFQRMFEALIIHLDRDEARALAPPEVLSHAPAVTGSIHHELEKVKFPEFFGAPDDAAIEAWLENMAMCFELRDYTSNMKVRMAVFQLKGGALVRQHRYSNRGRTPSVTTHITRSKINTPMFSRGKTPTGKHPRP